MRRFIANLLYRLASLFHEHTWQYEMNVGHYVDVKYRSCSHKECFVFEARTASGWRRVE
jgi:hypothetical protein